MADNYKAWEIDEKNFPKAGIIEEKIQFLIGYGILAPSTHNTQPWNFSIHKNKLEITPNTAVHLPAADPTGRNMFISLGACTFNIIVAAAKFKLSVKVRLVETSEKKSIALEFTAQKSDQELTKLFDQITRRYSEKRIIDNIPLNEKLQKEFQQISDPDVKVHLTTDRKSIQKLAELCYQAAASYASNPSFARELSGWMRGNKTSRSDGMPGFSSGLSSAKALTGKTLMKVLPKSLKILAKKYHKMLSSSSALGIMTSPSDDWKNWTKVGMKYEHLALIACSHNISLSPMAALIERPERSQIGKYFESTEKPQMFFRLTKMATKNLHTPRKITSRHRAEASIIERFSREGVPVILKSKQIGRFNINYIIAGKGRPLLLLHGANIGWGQWIPNLAELSKYYQVIALDLPGCGSSTMVNFNKLRFEEDFVKTTSEFIKQLNFQSLDIIGHSFGAAIATKLALNNDLKISKVVLISPLGFTRYVPGRQKLVTIYPFAKLLSRTAVKPSRKNMAKFLTDPLVQTDKITEELADYYWTATHENRHNHPFLFMHSLTNLLVLKPELNLIKELKAINQQILVIIGDKDPLIPLRKIKKRVNQLPNVRLEVFTHTGHVPSIEQPAKFSKTVVDFLT